MCCPRFQTAQKVHDKIFKMRIFHEYKSDNNKGDLFNKGNKDLPYHANRMFDPNQSGPLLFAGCGPRLPTKDVTETKEVKETIDENETKEEREDRIFLETTNNPANSKLDQFFNNKIEEVLALGSKVGSKKNYGIDFCDYAITPRTYEIGPFLVTVENHENNEKKFERDEENIIIRGTIKTKLTITDNQTKNSYNVNVTTMAFQDGGELAKDQNKELLELYNTSLKKNTYIHCQLGINRSAHVVLTFRLLYNYKTIFRQKKVEDTAQAIIDEVDLLREKRNPFLITRTQFYNAIHSAEVLYKLSLGSALRFFVPTKKMPEEQKQPVRPYVIPCGIL